MAFSAFPLLTLVVLVLRVFVSTAHLLDLDAVIERDVNSAHEIFHDREEKWEARHKSQFGFRGLNMLYSASRDEAKKSSVLDFRPSDLTHRLKLNGETFSMTGKPSEYSMKQKHALSLVSALQHAIHTHDAHEEYDGGEPLNDATAKATFVKWLSTSSTPQRVCDFVRSLKLSIVHPLATFAYDPEDVGKIGSRLAVNVAAMDVAAQHARACGVDVTLVRCEFADEHHPLMEGFVEAPRKMAQSANDDFRSAHNGAASGSPIKYPLVREVLALGREAAPDAQFMVLTNADVTPFPDFYLKLAVLLATGLDAIQFTRVGIAREIMGGWRASTPLHRYLSAVATEPTLLSAHPGADGFAFPTSRIPCMVKEVAMTHWGCAPYGSLVNIQLQYGSKCKIKVANAANCGFTFHLQHGGPGHRRRLARRKLSFPLCNNKVQFDRMTESARRNDFKYGPGSGGETCAGELQTRDPASKCPHQFQHERQGCNTLVRGLKETFGDAMGTELSAAFFDPVAGGRWGAGVQIAEQASGVASNGYWSTPGGRLP